MNFLVCTPIFYNFNLLKHISHHFHFHKKIKIVVRLIHNPLNKNEVGNIALLLLNLVQDILKKLRAMF